MEYDKSHYVISFTEFSNSLDLREKMELGLKFRQQNRNRVTNFNRQHLQFRKSYERSNILENN